jgi:uncharacterized membrane protein (UPF0136 family)
MDVRLADKRALVCASSSGLGYACAAALLREGSASGLMAATKSACWPRSSGLRLRPAGAFLLSPVT